MKITKLVLHLSKRLAFNGIKTFTYEPAKMHQLILGTNGSGKSSVMAELSPLPANPQDYTSGGYKHIELTHRGKTYQLTNTFTGKGGGRHNFICDNEELNPGGTVTVQKQLVTEHFNLDNELFELLIGVTNFREMSPIQRRSWLVKMSDDNMSEAIQLYNTIKGELRDKQAVLKHLSADIVDMVVFNKEISEKEEKLLINKRNADELAKGLQQLLMDMSKPVDYQPLEVIEQSIQSINRYATQLHSLRKDSTADKYLGDDLNKQKHQAEAKIDVIRQQRARLDKEAEQILEVIRTLTKEGAKDISDLTTKKDMLSGMIKQKVAEVIRYPKPTQTRLDIEASMNQTNVAESALIDVLDELPDNSDGQITREKFEKHRESREHALKRSNELTFQIAKVSHALSHFNKSNETVCPVCNHQYYLGTHGLDRDELQETLEEYNRQLRENEANIARCDDFLQSCTAYMTRYRELTSLMDKFHYLNPLWEQVRQVDLSKQHPSMIKTLFDEWKHDVLLWLDIQRLEENLWNVEASIESLASKNAESSELSHDRLKVIQQESKELHGDIQRLQHDIVMITQLQRMEAIIQKDTSEIQQLIQAVNTAEQDYYHQELVKFVRAEYLHAARTQNRLTDEHNDLIQYRTKMMELHEERQRVSKDIATLKVMLDELSPVNGLIADYSLNFVKQFTDQMNGIINSIWTYDMQIRPSAMNSDLSYKFPLYMANSDTETPDINRASTAQKGVIDFAFKLLLINYLGLEDYPLYIDELTPNLDETHRINIMHFVRDFVESGQCSQMFMISHYVDGNNVFPQAEFVIINDSNLLNKPVTYNTNVTMVCQ